MDARSKRMVATRNDNSLNTVRDECYTLYKDIEEEAKHYYPFFHDSHILCNCDDPQWSGFVRYCQEHQNEMRFSSLDATHFVRYDNDKAYCTHWERGMDWAKARYRMVKTGRKWSSSERPLLQEEWNGSGSYDCEESLRLLNLPNTIVFTNPPFKEYRNYIPMMIDSGADILCIGPSMSVTYASVYPYIHTGKLHCGYRQPGQHGGMWFRTPKEEHYRGEIKEVELLDESYFENANKKELDKLVKDGWAKKVLCNFWTTLPVVSDNWITSGMQYSPERYPQAENYYGIVVMDNCGSLSLNHVPDDYYGEMLVSVTSIGRINRSQFELLGCTNVAGYQHGLKVNSKPMCNNGPIVNGKQKNAALIIRRLNPRDKRSYNEYLERTYPSVDSSKQYIYIIRTIDKQYCKIGITNKPVHRLEGLQCGSPRYLEVEQMYGPFPSKVAEKVESTIHTMLDRFRVRQNGEWFDYTCNTEAKRLIAQATFNK